MTDTSSYLTLSDNPVRFKPGDSNNSVFFDDSNQQVNYFFLFLNRYFKKLQINR